MALVEILEEKDLYEFGLSNFELNKHIHVAVKFIVSRAFTHELVRHRRETSFAQESQRYVGYGDAIEFIIPSWCNIEPFETKGWIKREDGSLSCSITEDSQFSHPHSYESPDYIWASQCALSAYKYSELLEKGWRPEQARDVLPNATKTEIWIKTNLREWQHVFHLRDSMVAAPQMREMMEPLHIKMSGMVPIIFDKE